MHVRLGAVEEKEVAAMKPSKGYVLQGGDIALGLLWVALGYVLWSWRGTAAELPSRVS